MRIEIDKKARVCYITIKEVLNKPLKTRELDNNVYADYDANGELYGIEFLTLPEIKYLGEDS